MVINRKNQQVCLLTMTTCFSALPHLIQNVPDSSGNQTLQKLDRWYVQACLLLMGEGYVHACPPSIFAANVAFSNGQMMKGAPGSMLCGQNKS